VQIPGWLYNLRKSGKIVFPMLRDGTGLMQAVAVKSALPEAFFEEIKNLTQESSIILTGKIRKDERAPPAATKWTWKGSETIVQRVPEATRIRSRRKSTASTS
jgi:asparaginyl-tRNA synthetase